MTPIEKAIYALERSLDFKTSDGQKEIEREALEALRGMQPYNPDTHILIAKEDVPDVPTKLPEVIVESGRVTLSRKTFAYYAKMRSLIVEKL